MSIGNPQEKQLVGYNIVKSLLGLGLGPPTPSFRGPASRRAGCSGGGTGRGDAATNAHAGAVPGERF